MNIKELVLVISILLSIRIAEYAMKKYKEQKDVEVTKKQKSRKQTKKYIITAPSILKVGLPCGIFFGCTTIAFILSQIFKWEFVQQIENCYFMLICLLVSIGFTVLGIVLTLYGYIWKIEYDTQEIIYRSALGITRKYRIEDIRKIFFNHLIENNIQKKYTIAHKKFRNIPNIDLNRNVYNAGYITLHSLSIIGLKCMEVPLKKVKNFRKEEAKII